MPHTPGWISRRLGLIIADLKAAGSIADADKVATDRLNQLRQAAAAEAQASPAVAAAVAALLRRDQVDTTLIDGLREHLDRVPPSSPLAAAIRLFTHDTRRLADAVLALPEARRVLAELCEALHSDSSLANDLTLAGGLLAPETPTPADLRRAQDILSGIAQRLPAPEPLPAPYEARLATGMDTVVIFEDDDLWRRRLRLVAEDVVRQFGLAGVEEYCCASEFEAWIEKERSLPRSDRGYSLLLLDLGLPQRPLADPTRDPDDRPTWRNTRDLLRQYFSQDGPLCPVIVTTGHAELLDHVAAMGIGGLDFVFKDAPDDAALARSLQAIEARLRDRLQPLRAADCRLDFLDYTGNTVRFNGVHITLTGQQYGVLRLLSDTDDTEGKHPDQMVTEALMDGRLAITEDTPEAFADGAEAMFRRTARDALAAIGTQLGELGLRAPIDHVLRLPAANARQASRKSPCWRLECPTRVIRDPLALALEEEPFSVLIVEDEPATREHLLAELDAIFDGMVTAVADGDELHHALLAHSYDAVVLDLEFPAADTDGPLAGVEAYRELVQDHQVRSVIVYSRHDTDVVHQRLNRLAQQLPGREWESLLRSRPPAFVPKTAHREEDIADLVVLLARAQLERLRQAPSADPGPSPGGALPQVVLPLSAAAVRLHKPRSEDDLAANCGFLVEGRFTHPRKVRESRLEPYRAYNLLYLLALAPGTYLSTRWLLERLVQDGIVAGPSAKSEVHLETTFTRAITCLRAGIRAACPEPEDAAAEALADALVTESNQAYCLNAEVKFVDDLEWTRLTALRDQSR